MLEKRRERGRWEYEGNKWSDGCIYVGFFIICLLKI